jgi:phosphopantothenoylcysteine decarboxylase/phosphopantothenate--cysteine ligase
MGYAIAKQLQKLGAEVTLVSGPTSLEIPAGIERINVQSAAEMLAACSKHFEESDITVMSAAVADYTPTEVANKKIKKKAEDFSIALKKTTDILASLGKVKKDHQTLVGFALETNNELENAIDKLKRKNLDFIVLNSMQDKGAGFAHDTNKVTVINKNAEVLSFDLKSKDEVAKDICELIIKEQNK